MKRKETKRKKKLLLFKLILNQQNKAFEIYFNYFLFHTIHTIL